jgi:hypothetical protein
MIPHRRLLPLLLLLLSACTIFPQPGSTPTALPPTETVLVPATATAVPTLAPPTETPLPTATLVLPDLPPLLDASADDFLIRTHPDGGLFVGDQVSFEVIAPEGLPLEDREVVIWSGSTEIARTTFGRFGIGGRPQATLWWVWDTSRLDAGEYSLDFAIEPGGPTWQQTLLLQPESAHAFPEPTAEWVMASSDCCQYYYVTGTAAERDLDSLMIAGDEQALSAIEAVGGEFDEPIVVVLLPRLMGHGGFAGAEVYISYLDRNYAGNAPAQVLHHEMVHILDRRKGGDYRPTFFVEGLAVYLSGGHFKPEPLLARAAEVLDLDWFIPLSPLADDFYPAQHELSYLEAAALIEYMVDTWGWETFDAFYRDIHEHPNKTASSAIDSALLEHYGLTFLQLETQFLDVLAEFEENPVLEDDVRLTVAFFDTVRRYEQAFDSSAYFLTAWLPGIDDLLERGIVADYLRHPVEAHNIALETLLVRADQDLRAADIASAESHINAVNGVLDAFDAAEPQPFHADPLAADHLAITLALLELGFEPQQIRVTGTTAEVLATQNSAALIEFQLARGEAGWQVVD